jgi:hypothetical protein
MAEWQYRGSWGDQGASEYNAWLVQRLAELTKKVDITGEWRGGVYDRKSWSYPYAKIADLTMSAKQVDRQVTGSMISGPRGIRPVFPLHGDQHDMAV